MSVNNLFLGTAKGSVGDVTMYRRNGKQVSRVRVREVANPRSEGQAISRCFLAPVARFYAPLAGCLERSWEGRNKSDSYTQFLKKNIELARNEQLYVPKGAPYLALPYQVSKGTLPPTVYDFTDGLFAWLRGFDTASPTLGDLSRTLIEAGYLSGDQLTFIGFIANSPNYLADGVIPAYARIFLDENSTVSLAGILGSVLKLTVETAGLDSCLRLGSFSGTLIAGAIIVSRYNGTSWLRSSQYVVCDKTYLGNLTSPMAKYDAIASYRGQQEVNPSDIYLNGSLVIGRSSKGGGVTYDVTDSAGVGHKLIGFQKQAVDGLTLEDGAIPLTAVFEDGTFLPITCDTEPVAYDSKVLIDNAIGEASWADKVGVYTDVVLNVAASETEEVAYNNWLAMVEAGLSWSIMVVTS